MPAYFELATGFDTSSVVIPSEPGAPLDHSLISCLCSAEPARPANSKHPSISLDLIWSPSCFALRIPNNSEVRDCSARSQICGAAFPQPSYLSNSLWSLCLCGEYDNVELTAKTQRPHRIMP